MGGGEDSERDSDRQGDHQGGPQQQGGVRQALLEQLGHRHVVLVGVAQIQVDKRAKIEQVLLRDRVGIAVLVGQAQPVEAEVDLFLVDPRVLADTDRLAGREPGQGEEHGGHEEEEEDPDGDATYHIERHALIL